MTDIKIINGVAHHGRGDRGPAVLRNVVAGGNAVRSGNATDAASLSNLSLHSNLIVSQSCR